MWFFKKYINIYKLRQKGVYTQDIFRDVLWRILFNIINMKAVSFQSSTFIIKYHSKEMYCIFFGVLYLQEVKGLYLSLRIKTKPFSWWLSTLITHARPLENSCTKQIKTRRRDFNRIWKKSIQYVLLIIFPRRASFSSHATQYINYSELHLFCFCCAYIVLKKLLFRKFWWNNWCWMIYLCWFLHDCLFSFL